MGGGAGAGNLRPSDWSSSVQGGSATGELFRHHGGEDLNLREGGSRPPANKPVITCARMFLGFRAARLALAVAPFLVACGGSSFDGRVFSNGELSFRVARVPPEWHPIEAPGTLLAFRDDRTPASVSVSGRCGKDGDDVPLESLTHHLFLSFTDRRVT